MINPDEIDWAWVRADAEQAKHAREHRLRELRALGTYTQRRDVEEARGHERQIASLDDWIALADSHLRLAASRTWN